MNTAPAFEIHSDGPSWRLPLTEEAFFPFSPNLPGANITIRAAMFEAFFEKLYPEEP